MVAVLETWTRVGGRGLGWAEVLVSDGDVNLDEEKKTETVREAITPFPWGGLAGLLSRNRLRMAVLRTDPRGVCCPSSRSGQRHREAAQSSGGRAL